MALRPRRRRRFRASLQRASAALDADWSIETTWPALAANTARFLGRDYPLDRQSDEAVLSRFEVRGYERLRATLADGRGAILVGSHLGAHIAGVHWLFRRGVSGEAAGSAPQARFSRAQPSIRRAAGRTPRPRCSCAAISPGQCAVERVFRARAALRDGLADLLERGHPVDGPQYLRRPAARPASALSGRLDRAGRTDERAGLPRVLHSSARRSIRARDRSHGPPARRRGRICRRRLSQTARSTHRGLTRRRRRTPRMAMLRIATCTRPSSVRARCLRPAALTARWPCRTVDYDPVLVRRGIQ